VLSSQFSFFTLNHSGGNKIETGQVIH
jgi:hypothetical protein